MGYFSGESGDTMKWKAGGKMWERGKLHEVNVGHGLEAHIIMYCLQGCAIFYLL